MVALTDIQYRTMRRADNMIDWIHDTRDEYGRCLIIIHGSKGKKTYLVNYGWTVEDAKEDYERWDGES